MKRTWLKLAVIGCVAALFISWVDRTSEENISNLRVRGGVEKIEFISVEKGRITNIRDSIIGPADQPLMVAEVEFKRDGVYVSNPIFFWKEKPYKRNDRVDVYRYRITALNGLTKETTLLTPLPN
jgi:hypothetical protein